MNLTIYDFIIIAVVAVFGIIGYIKGAINTLISFLGMIASFSIARFLSPMAAQMVVQTNFFNQLINDYSINTVNQFFQQSETSGLVNTSGGFIEKMINEGINSGSDILNTVLTPILENILSIVLFIVIFIICGLILMFIKRIGRKFNKVPVLGFANRIVGFTMSGVMALIVVWVILYVVILCALLLGNTALILQLEQGVITGPLISVML